MSIIASPAELEFDELEIGMTSEIKVGKVKLGNKRVTGKEQYYTPIETAESILNILVELIPDLTHRTFLEPAGGTGAFIEAALSHGIKKIVSFDIEPHHPRVQYGSFLEQSLELSGAVTVTNPPFGRCNSLAVPFFNKAAKHSDYVVFIIPRSWRKWSVLNKLDANFELIRDDDLNIDYVDTEGQHTFGKNNLRTCIQYWKRKESGKRIKYSVRDMGIIEKCKFDKADASLTIFGYSCGIVRTEFPRKPNTTQMFLKLKHPRALEALQAVDFSKFYLNTAYTEALSISEINYLLNDYIFGDPKLENARKIDEPELLLLI